jgi:hypothetical protein
MAAMGSLLRFALLLVALLWFVVFGFAVGPTPFPAARLVTRVGASAGCRGCVTAGFGAHDHFCILAQLVGAVDHDAITGLEA